LPTVRALGECKRVKGDVLVVGLKFSAEEWMALDEATRAELVELARPRQMIVHIAGGRLAEGSGPHEDVIEIV
jgi:hypothetical protein